MYRFLFGNWNFILLKLAFENQIFRIIKREAMYTDIKNYNGIKWLWDTFFEDFLLLLWGEGMPPWSRHWLTKYIFIYRVLNDSNEVYLKRS